MEEQQCHLTAFRRERFEAIHSRSVSRSSSGGPETAAANLETRRTESPRWPHVCSVWKTMAASGGGLPMDATRTCRSVGHFRVGPLMRRACGRTLVSGPLAKGTRGSGAPWGVFVSSAPHGWTSRLPPLGSTPRHPLHTNRPIGKAPPRGPHLIYEPPSGSRNNRLAQSVGARTAYTRHRVLDLQLTSRVRPQGIRTWVRQDPAGVQDKTKTSGGTPGNLMIIED